MKIVDDFEVVPVVGLFLGVLSSGVQCLSTDDCSVHQGNRGPAGGPGLKGSRVKMLMRMMKTCCVSVISSSVCLSLLFL